MAALGVSALTGCSRNECKFGELMCDGNSAMNCIASEGDFVWKNDVCGALQCKVTSYGALCVVNTTPDPGCDAKDTPFCDGTTVTICQAGYATATHDCASGASAGVSGLTDNLGVGPYCVTPKARALCAIDPEPSRVCNKDDFASVLCDGNDNVQCEQGYETSRTDCGAGFCKPVAANFCAQANDPDPGCSTDDLRSTFCEGDSVVQCFETYRVSTTDCAVGKKCIDTPNSDCPGCTTASCVAR